MKSKYAYKDNRLSVSIIDLPMNITDTKSTAFAHVAIKRKGAVIQRFTTETLHVIRSIKDKQHKPEYVRLLLKAKIELYIYEYLKYIELMYPDKELDIHINTLKFATEMIKHNKKFIKELKWKQNN